MTRDKGTRRPPPTHHRIVEWWLEGTNLHTVEADGAHYIYRDAKIQGIKQEISGVGITVEPLTFVGKLHDE
jgi:hypothetical protein